MNFLIFIFCCLSLSSLHAEDLSDVFQRVKNSVVSITVQQKNAVTSSSTVENLSLQGTGVLSSDRRQVMTSAYLVQTADWIEVGVATGTAISARIESSAMQADVALLELEKAPQRVHGAKFGNSDRTLIGESVFVVSVSSDTVPRMIVCHITGRQKPDTIMENFLQADFFQIDSKLDQRDAGAPLFNANGEVIGIVSNILSSAAGLSGMGFAVPSNLAVNLMLNEPFLWSGVSGRLLRGRSARFFNLPQDEGFLIEKISSASASARLGLRAGTKMAVMDGSPIITGGDIVLEVEGISFAQDNALNQVRNRLKKIPNGGTLHVKIFRDGKIEELSSIYNR